MMPDRIILKVKLSLANMSDAKATCNCSYLYCFNVMPLYQPAHKYENLTRHLTTAGFSSPILAKSEWAKLQHILAVSEYPKPGSHAETRLMDISIGGSYCQL